MSSNPVHDPIERLKEQAAEEARRREAEQRRLKLLQDLHREDANLRYYGEGTGAESSNRGFAEQIAKYLAVFRATGLGNRFDSLQPRNDHAWTVALEVYRLCDQGDLDAATAKLDEADTLGRSWARHGITYALKTGIPDAILSPHETLAETKPLASHPLVAERAFRRPSSSALARDPDRHRQSRYCQGFDPDWFVPADKAAEWRSFWYPLQATRESVEQWRQWIASMRVEYLGPFESPDRAKELNADLENDLNIIRQCAPHLLVESSPPTIGKMPLSRLDLPRIVEAIQELHRIIAHPPAENSQPPAWLVEQYKQTTLGEAGVPEKPAHSWLIDAAATEVLNRLMPPWHRRGGDCPEITESLLDQRHKVQLIELRNLLLSSFALGQGLVANRSEAVRILGFLETVLEHLNSDWLTTGAGAARDQGEAEQGEEAGAGEGTGENGTPTAPEEVGLTDRQMLILETMLEHEITSDKRRKNRQAIVRKVNRTHNWRTYSRDFAALVKLGYLKSREGPHGGMWLTPQGMTEAVRLRLENNPHQTVT
jgi:hypothetical protein